MTYKVLSSRVEIRGIGTFTRGDQVELDPKIALSISGPGGAQLEPIKPVKQREEDT